PAPGVVPIGRAAHRWSDGLAVPKGGAPRPRGRNCYPVRGFPATRFPPDASDRLPANDFTPKVDQRTFRLPLWRRWPIMTKSKPARGDRSHAEPFTEPAARHSARNAPPDVDDPPL